MSLRRTPSRSPEPVLPLSSRRAADLIGFGARALVVSSVVLVLTACGADNGVGVQGEVDTGADTVEPIPDTDGDGSVDTVDDTGDGDTGSDDSGRDAAADTADGSDAPEIGDTTDSSEVEDTADGSGEDTGDTSGAVDTSGDTDTTDADDVEDTDVADTTDPGDTNDVEDTSDTADAPDTSDVPDVEDTSDTADVPDTMDTSDTADVPDTLDTSDTADVPDTADTTDVADTLDVPDMADTLDVADTSDTTDTGAWTPPGPLSAPWIAFVARQSGLERVFVIRADGSDLTLIDTGDPLAYDPTWSPDGTRLAIRALGSPYNVIRIVDVTTGAVETIEPGLARISSLTWSPGGEFLAFEGKAETTDDSDIYIYDLDTDVMERLTTASTTEGGPAWAHPDRVYYVVSPDDTNFDVFSHVVSTGTVSQVTYDESVTGTPDVSWDGRYVVFQKRTGADTGELVVRDTVRGTVDTVGSAIARGPAVSPDGLWFAYVDDADDGDPEILITDFSFETTIQVTDSAVGESNVDIAPVESSGIEVVTPL